jgi:hypothetical protein
LGGSGGFRSRVRSAAGVGALAALAVAGGFFLAGVPNVEIITLIVFASGWLLGVKRGAAVGVVGMFVFTLANPYGAAVPLLAFAQVACMGLIGACGGVWSQAAGDGSAVPVALGLLGALLTLVYDVATNVAIGISFSQVRPTLIAGLPFAIVHVLANSLIFALAGPYLMRGLVSAGLAPAGRTLG